MAASVEQCQKVQNDDAGHAECCLPAIDMVLTEGEAVSLWQQSRNAFSV